MKSANEPASLRLRTARVEWQDGQPRAADFDDIYHSADGANEVRRVFLKPSGIAERLKAGVPTTVAELGFGTALNLAVLLQAWRASPRARLHFLSCERYPLAVQDWQRVIAARRGQLDSYRDLDALYPPPVPGWHRRSLAGGRVQLSLFWGDATFFLEELSKQPTQSIDAWWLDGFAPERNPELWTPDLLQTLTSVSRPGTRVATFTVAGRVRRALSAAGFTLARIDQRPYKRESLAGTLTAAGEPARGQTADRWTEARTAAARAPITVVGAGLAGAWVARQLVEAGFCCRVLEAGPRPLGGSALPTAAAHARLLLDTGPNGAQRACAQLFTTHRLQALGGPALLPGSGTVQLAGDSQGRGRLEQLAARFGDERWCRRIDGTDLKALRAGYGPATAEAMALHFPGAAVVDPQTLTHQLLDHPQITVYWQRPWSAASSSGGLTIHCSGLGVRALAAAVALEVAPLGGQLDAVQCSKRPTVALVGHGYLVPDVRAANRLWVGGNYEYRPWSPATATATNLQQLPAKVKTHWQARRRGVRLTTSDRQPIVGPLPSAAPSRTAPPQLLCVGFGSQALTQAPLAAAQLASRLAGWVSPLTQAQEAALAPDRFLARQAKRGALRGFGPGFQRG